MKMLPILPKNLMEAYLMGSYVKGYQIAESSGDNNGQNENLDLLKNLTGRSRISSEELLGIHSEIEAFMNHRSIIQRVLGMFTFVNTIWMVSLIGMTVLFIPCISSLFKHIIEPILRKLYQIAEWIFKEIIVPTITFLHEWGIFEVGLYLGSSQIITEASWMDVNQQTSKQMASIICFTGLIISYGGFLYSTLLHAAKIRTKSDPQKVQDISALYIMLVCIPLAIVFQSSALGYVVFAIFFVMVGFRMYFFGLGIALGWNNKDDLERSALTAALVMIWYALIRANGINEEYTKPFASSSTILGANIHYLALLIYSSRYYSRGNSVDKTTTTPYVVRNALAICSMVVGLLIGQVYVLQGMYNTCLTYLVLWLIEKYHEIFFQVSHNVVVFAFTIFGLMYWAALYLNQNPEFIVSLF